MDRTGLANRKNNRYLFSVNRKLFIGLKRLRYYEMLRDRDGCIRVLRKAVDGGYFNYPFMLTDSFLDSVRDDPEFQKILEKAKEKHLAFKQKFFAEKI